MAEAHHLVKLESKTRIGEFRVGDTIRVSFRVREGERERTQSFQGVVIRKRGGGPAASFTVRRVTHGIGVERIFPLNSPLLELIEVLRRGDVRRARLYYLRSRFGRAARIKEKGLGVAIVSPQAAKPGPTAEAPEETPETPQPEASQKAQESQST
jgi:large subunit ribosomal protein L19